MKHLLSVILVFLPALGCADNYTDREEVKTFVSELAVEAGFDERELMSLFSHAEYKQSIVDAISRPAEKTLNWAQYQDIFLTERRLAEGLDFMEEHREVLDAAHERFGVPPVVVTAIIGVETFYGRIAGSYRVLDALSTLSFDYPPRSRFFRKELKEFILLAREERQMITDFTGSYAGAMGMGQFIPSSYRRYAVDFDEDGYRDIWKNPADAIGSVANYLSEHRWRRNAPVTQQVGAKGVPADVFNVSLKPSRSLEEVLALGVVPSQPVVVDPEEKVSPMRLEGKQGDEFWLGFHNFYVITRYNHSKLYAMAVYQLSESLRKGQSSLAAR
jgi:membrane-bound lytic murein transglycosylase B